MGVGRTFWVAEAAVTDAGAAASLHGLQVLVVSEVTLLQRRREVLHHRVELTEHVIKVFLVHKSRCKNYEKLY